ncbi:MAG: hypothetical protein IMZ69_10725 [Spirochaetes bacterium]|nr:hypothetical protein [Spirochaetota bacterium]
MTRDFEIAVKYAECKAAMQRISDTELPEAIAAGINRVAGGAALGQRVNLRQDFILRNQYTERSLAFYKANPKKNIDRINAIVGSRQPYLALQEEGGKRRPVRGGRVPVPTKRARGGNWRAPIQRRYTIRKGTKVGRGSKFFILRPGTNPSGLNTRHTLARYRRMIAKNPAYTGRKNWMYRLTSPAIFKREDGDLVKVRLLDQPSYQLKGKHWHRDAVEKYGTQAFAQMAFIAEARRRLAKYQAS